MSARCHLRPSSLTEAQLESLLDIGGAAEEGEAFKAAEFDRSRSGGREIRQSLHEAGLIFGRSGRGYEGVRLFLTAAGRGLLEKKSGDGS